MKAVFLYFCVLQTVLVVLAIYNTIFRKCVRLYQKLPAWISFADLVALVILAKNVENVQNYRKSANPPVWKSFSCLSKQFSCSLKPNGQVFPLVHQSTKIPEIYQECVHLLLPMNRNAFKNWRKAWYSWSSLTPRGFGQTPEHKRFKTTNRPTKQ